jgi:hypothetical protein
MARRVIGVSPTMPSEVPCRRGSGVNVGGWAGRVNRDMRRRMSAAMIRSASLPTEVKDVVTLLVNPAVYSHVGIRLGRGDV